MRRGESLKRKLKLGVAAHLPLDAAIEQMRSLKDINGRPLGIKPGLLVVGPKLRSQANKTVKVMLSEGGASNANYNAVDVLDTDWAA